LTTPGAADTRFTQKDPRRSPVGSAGPMWLAMLSWMVETCSWGLRPVSWASSVWDIRGQQTKHNLEGPVAHLWHTRVRNAAQPGQSASRNHAQNGRSRAFCAGSGRTHNPSVFGPSPMRLCQQYSSPVAVRCLVAITHTFRHIFWPQPATTSHKFPMVRNRRSRCGAMVSTTIDN
jgi:hypothetical protein